MYQNDKTVETAANRLITAFGQHDRGAYCACFAPEASFIFYNQPQRLNTREEYLREWLRWGSGR